MNKIRRIRTLLAYIDQCNEQVANLSKVLNERLFIDGFSAPEKELLPDDLAEENRKFFERLLDYYTTKKAAFETELDIMTMTAITPKHND